MIPVEISSELDIHNDGLPNHQTNIIPPFTVSGVLPPYLGNPATGSLSPYEITLRAIVERFGFSKERLLILQGFIKYRIQLNSLGFVEGKQWLDGSFVEDIEKTEGRSPNDVDIVTLCRRPQGVKEDHSWIEFALNNMPLFNPSSTKLEYKCDAYFIDLDVQSETIVDSVKYWFGLFSHRRESNLWKGMLQIDLRVTEDDNLLLAHIESELMKCPIS